MGKFITNPVLQIIVLAKRVKGRVTTNAPKDVFDHYAKVKKTLMANVKIPADVAPEENP